MPLARLQSHRGVLGQGQGPRAAKIRAVDLLEKAVATAIATVAPHNPTA